MKRFTYVFTLFVFAFLFFIPTGFCETAKIYVTGTSQLSVEPDQAKLSFSCISTGATAEEARQNNNLIITQTLLALKDLKIPQSQIQTSHYIVYPIFQEQDKTGKPPAIIGYKVTTTLTVITNKLEQAGLIVDKAFQSGINQVDRISFEKQNLKDVKGHLLKLAVLDGMSKAQAMADSLGRKLGKVVSITENQVSVQDSENSHYFLKSSALSTTSLASGSLNASSSVSLVIELD